MKRLALGLVLFTAGCEERLSQSRLVALVHDEAGSGQGVVAGPHVIPPAECTGRCCPKDCPVPARDGATYSGPECYAQLDNTGRDRWQFRQTMSVSERPPGVHTPLVASTLLWRSEFRSPGCNTPVGTGGFMQLLEFDRKAGTSRVGFARYERDPARALADGLCFVEGTYDDDPGAGASWRLDRLYDPVWPAGLPKPRLLPWKVSPSLTKRVIDRDFDLAKERESILARFAADGDLAQYQGLFFLDEERGYLHGFSPLTFIVNYEDAQRFNAIPIREAELTIQMNDPEHPNCIGSLLGDNPVLPNSCDGTPTERAWGCYPGNCASGELAPSSVKGYFLVVEMEQIYNPTLTQTLCHAFPASLPDWTGKVSCREDPKWDPTEPVHGIPAGDWCAATNDVATPECHDAMRSISYATFQAFPIREETCPAR